MNIFVMNIIISMIIIMCIMFIVVIIIISSSSSSSMMIMMIMTARGLRLVVAHLGAQRRQLLRFGSLAHCCWLFVHMRMTRAMRADTHAMRLCLC